MSRGEAPQVEPFVGPPPQAISVKAGALVVPVVASGQLDEATKTVCSVFGLDIDVLLVDDAIYTVLSSHLAEARGAIRKSKVSGAPLGVLTAKIPMLQVNVPSYQPQVTPARAHLYTIIGVDTVDVVMGTAVFTVLAGHLAAAKAALGSLLGQKGDEPEGISEDSKYLHKSTSARGASSPTCQPRGSPMPSGISRPSAAGLKDSLSSSRTQSPSSSSSLPPPAHYGRSVTIVLKGFTLMDYYVECPRPEILAVAAMLGVRFLCVQTPDQKTIWVPNSPGCLDATARRLGLYV
jgi:hypothetical protein